MQRATKLLITVFLIGSMSGCARIPQDPYYEKSPDLVTFDYKSDLPFAEYVQHTRQQVDRNRIFFDPDNKAEELEQVAAFEIAKNPACPDGPGRGILFIHGLSDTAFVFKDLAAAFEERCFVVRVLLLAGHGTRPADLIDVSYEEWIDAVEYGIRSLQRDVDEVYVGGFSLGGLLAANAALDHPDLNGVFLFSPAMGILWPWLSWHATWLRHFVDWLDVDERSMAIRYQSMPVNGIAETYALTQYVDERIEAAGQVTPPVMLLVSLDDWGIQAEDAINFFSRFAINDRNQALVYGTMNSAPADPRVQVVNSFIPEQKILNFSHLTLPYAAHNPVFGVQGSFKECGQNVGVIPEERSRACLDGEHNWKGELGSADEDKYGPVQRLTYNPLFAEMMQEIDRFIEESAE